LNWYAVFTKPRSEDHVARLLSLAGIESLSPRIAHKRFVGVRACEVIEPLFPCYMFAYFEVESMFRTVKYTRGVRYVVGRDLPVPVPRGIIEGIRARMEDGVVRIERESLTVGERVVINAGPLKGLEGIFSRYTKGSERALLLLRAINSRLEVESWQVSRACAGQEFLLDKPHSNF
jgi:transcriptional antiterminator RfaH